MSSPIHRLHAYLIEREAELGRADVVAPGLATLVRLGRFTASVVVEFFDDHCLSMAAGLSYTSLLALVPLSALFFSIFTNFQAFVDLRADVQQFITERLFSNEKIGHEIMANLDRLSNNAKQLGIFSLAALIVTVISLMITIENSLNAIWKVVPRRKLLSRVITYAALVFLAPILLALSLYTTNQAARTLLVGGAGESGLWKLLSGFSVSSLMFFLAYIVVPEAKVGLRPALLGGCVAGALFEWAKWGFNRYIQSSTYYFDVYQTLWIIPIFLFWLYLAWVIALLGVEIVYVFQNRHNLRSYSPGSFPAGDVSENLLIGALAQVGRHYSEGRSEENTVQALADELGVPIFQMALVLAHLEQIGLLHRADPGESFYPSRPLDQITLFDAVEKVPTEQVLVRLGERDPHFARLRDLVLQCSEYRRERLEGVTLSELARNGGRRGDPGAGPESDRSSGQRTG